MEGMHLNVLAGRMNYDVDQYEEAFPKQQQHFIRLTMQAIDAW